MKRIKKGHKFNLEFKVTDYMADEKCYEITCRSKLKEDIQGSRMVFLVNSKELEKFLKHKDKKKAGKFLTYDELVEKGLISKLNYG